MKVESIRIQQEMGSAGKSSMGNYCDLIVGRPGLWALLKYELIIMCCSIVPGALGLLLRSLFYPLLLKRCGKKVFFGTNVVLRHPGKIEIGDNVVIDDNCLLDAKGHSNRGINIGSGVFLGRNSILSCKNGDIVLGENVNIGFNSEIFSGSLVSLERDVLVAAYCYFIGGDHQSTDLKEAVNTQGASSKGIRVGEKSWFGANVKILDGVDIGSNAIIGAGAVVTKNIPAYAVAVGIPAKPVADRRDVQSQQS